MRESTTRSSAQRCAWPKPTLVLGQALIASPSPHPRRRAARPHESLTIRASRPRVVADDAGVRYWMCIRRVHVGHSNQKSGQCLHTTHTLCLRSTEVSRWARGVHPPKAALLLAAVANGNVGFGAAKGKTKPHGGWYVLSNTAGRPSNNQQQLRRCSTATLHRCGVVAL